MYATRGATAMERLVGLLIGAFLTAWFLLATWWVAWPAAREVAAVGYGGGRTNVSAPEVHPYVRLMVLGFGSEPPPGQARGELNTVVRQATPCFYLILFLAVVSVAIEGVATERRQGTWPGLLATPLTGAEIVRAKMLGAVWRTRWYVGLTVGLWAVGLAAGAVHPLGFVAALAGLVASAWFYAALGTFAAVRSGAAEETAGWSIMLLMLLSATGAGLLWLPPRGLSVLMGAGSMPLLGWLSLVSYDDVRVALRSGEFPRLAEAGIRTGEGALTALAAWLIGVGAHAAAALALTRAAVRGFDAAVGRPVRPGSHGSPELAPQTARDGIPSVAPSCES
jgi:hypothetical protein